MASVLTQYSMADVSFLVDGREVSGFFGQDDSIMIESDVDENNVEVGSDGCAIASLSANRAKRIKVKVSPTCDGHQLLTNMMNLIRNRARVGFAVSVTNTGNGEGGSSTQATITKVPAVSFGTNATEREWEIFANDWQPNTVNYTLQELT